MWVFSKQQPSEFHKINDLMKRPVYVFWMKVQSEGRA